AFPNLTTVDLSGNYIKKIQNIHNTMYSRDLNLLENKIEKIENLDHVICLIDLDLFSNNIAKVKNIEKLVNIHKINLCTNKINEMKIPDNGKYSSNLKSVDLSYNSITILKIIVQLKDCSEIKQACNQSIKIQNESQYLRINKILKICPT
ncbi:uncharacterized protein ASCRUDRAFT_35374, partial [Ascoidea rubescens DSM 1968]